MLDKIRTALSGLGDRIVAQEWYLQLKSKWEEIEPQRRGYYKLAFATVGGFLCLYFAFDAIGSVYSLRSELRAKREALATMRSASDELHSLQSASAGAGAEAQPWPQYFQGIAVNSRLDPATIKVSDEKKPGGPGSEEKKPSDSKKGAENKKNPANDIADEVLLEVALSKIKIADLVRFVVSVEGGSRPVKIRTLTVERKGDNTGGLDATLSLSAFQIK